MNAPQNPVFLRPLGVGELIDGVFRLYRANFFNWLGITAFTFLPALLALIVLFILLQIGGTSSEWMGLALIVFFLAAGLIALLVQYFTLAALIASAARAYFGQPVSIREAYRLGWKRAGSLLLAGMLMFLAFLPGFVVAVIPCIGMLPMMLYMGLLFTRWSVATAGIVVEDLGAVDGLRRSWRLTQGYFWRALGVIVVNGMLSYLIAGLPQNMVQWVSFALLDYPLAMQILQILGLLLGQLGQMLILPLGAAAFVLLYYDLRVRKEGYDLQLLAEQAAAQQANGAGELPISPLEG